MENILHHLECQKKPLQMMVNKLPTSSGVEFTGFLKHQQYQVILGGDFRDFFNVKIHGGYHRSKGLNRPFASIRETPGEGLWTPAIAAAEVQRWPPPARQRPKLGAERTAAMTRRTIFCWTVQPFNWCLFNFKLYHIDGVISCHVNQKLPAKANSCNLGAMGFVRNCEMFEEELQ